MESTAASVVIANAIKCKKLRNYTSVVSNGRLNILLAFLAPFLVKACCVL